MPAGIGTLRESSLHESLKRWYSQPMDEVEKLVDGYTVDLFRDGSCIEIQTNHIYMLKRKVTELLKNFKVQVVYPIPQERYIIRIDNKSSIAISRRKSPKRGSFLGVFNELVYIPSLVVQPNFSIEVVLIREELVLFDDGKGSWRRRGWSILDRRLINIVSSEVFLQVSDYLKFLPERLPARFSVSDLADKIGCSTSLARKMAYCMRKTGLLEITGKIGRAYQYKVTGRTLVS